MKLPFDLGIKLVFRLLIPGFILALGFLPILRSVWHWGAWSFQVEYAFLLSVFLLGWSVTILDQPIYMFFEGRRLWPSILKNYLISREKKRLEQIIDKEKKYFLRNISLTEDNPTSIIEIVATRQKSLECWYDIRKFPMNDQGHYVALFPTRLGNLITAFETYPKIRYGMDSAFYFYRIWLKLDKDLRDELDTSQAISDSILYTSVAFYINAILWLIYSILITIGNPIIRFLPPAKVSWFLFLACLIIGFALYRASLYSQTVSGELFKSVFDVHQKDFKVDGVVSIVSEITGIPELRGSIQREKYRIAWRYLQNYRVQCPHCQVPASPNDIGNPNCDHNIY